MADFGPQEVASLAYAFATVNYRSPLFKDLTYVVSTRAAEFSPQGLSNVAWALAKLDLKQYAGTLETMARTAVGRIGDFNAQDLVHHTAY